MPIRDWQFWLVSLLALYGLWLLARPLLPFRRAKSDDAACPSCSSGSATPRKTQHRVALTIGRRRI
ncbi:MAG: hypothetical protein L0Y44_00045 [Phycisphaerales bacterium]|nr:hypothetical protein [Phycisphaerales bacterium]MCI0629028.1 hypothetical protein [Phycisphaerales bacterium]MCI0674785.1 hypothetical protein [Phycisphaerales bacterium]